MCQERLAQGCGSTALAVNMHLFALGSMMENIANLDVPGASPAAGRRLAESP